MTQTLSLDELKNISLEELLQKIAERSARVLILLPDGKEMVIEVREPLQPLPELEGRVPEGWKEAING